MEKNVERRRQEILELLSKEGQLEVSTLSQTFGVSAVVIRKDLQELEDKGLLSRVHGGAVSSYKTYYNMSFRQRSQSNEDEKHAIAEYIADVVEDNDTLFINAGTTTLFCFRVLSKRKNLNIVTNSVAIAIEASEMQETNVVLLGGSVNSKYQFTYGTEAMRLLKRYHADKLILSVDGVSADDGLTTYYQQEADLCFEMMQRAAKTIVVADYTKISRTTFTKIAPLSAADMIVTNENPGKGTLSKLKKSGIEIITV